MYSYMYMCRSSLGVSSSRDEFVLLTHMYTHSHTRTNIHSCTNWLMDYYREAKMHMMPYLSRSFSAKEPLIIVFFRGK